MIENKSRRMKKEGNGDEERGQHGMNCGGDEGGRRDTRFSFSRRWYPVPP